MMKPSYTFLSLLACVGVLSACQEQASVTTPIPTSDPAHAQAEANKEDPFLWLEDTGDAKTTEWVADMNARTLEQLQADPRFGAVKENAKSILNRTNRLPGPTATRQYRNYIYHILQDAEHPQGVLRRATLNSYASGNPDWQTLVDIGPIAEAEGRSWFGSIEQSSFSPSGKRMLVSLSDGGTDAVALREFDLETGQFVEGGFQTKAGRQGAVWVDEDTLLIGLVLEPDGATMGGAPRKTRLWKRGESLANSQVVFTEEKTKILTRPVVLETADWRATSVLSVDAGFNGTLYVMNSDNVVQKLDLPGPLTLSAFGGLKGFGTKMLTDIGYGWVVDGKALKAGTLVSIDIEQMLNETIPNDDAIDVVYEFAADEAFNIFNNITTTRDAVYVNILKNVASDIRRLDLGDNGEWRMSQVEGIPGPGTVWLPLFNDPYAESLVFRYEDFITPLTEYRLENGKPVIVRRETSNTDLSQFKTTQFFADAEDGTKIPYFVTHRKDIKFDGKAPVLMYGYGGFGYAVTPSFEVAYSGPLHELWLESGGVFVSVNPRGGGEYGKTWHETARGQTRQIVYDDIYAIADDVIARKLGTAGRMGFIGGSNGGLTAAVLGTQRPDLFGATIAVVPVIDMMRYHKLLGGIAWVPEYGNPDVPADKDALLGYSPYHVVRPGENYTEMLVMTSTKDDRVHPAHARKFAAKMAKQGHPVMFYEAPEGGHAMAVDNEGRSTNAAIMATYLFQKLDVK